MAQKNERHAAIILDCLISTSHFGQREREPPLAWSLTKVAPWAAYVAEKIRQTEESPSGVTREDDA